MEDEVRKATRWLKLQLLLNHATVRLRDTLFTLVSVVRDGREWTGSVEGVAFRTEILNKETLSLAYNPCERVTTGDMDNWTLETMLCVFRALGKKWLTQELIGLVNNLSEVKHFLAFHPTKIVSKEDLSSKSNVVAQALSFMGAPLLRITQDVESHVANISSLVSPTVTDRGFTELLRMADHLLSEDHCQKAVEILCGALERKSLKEEEKGIFFCKISACHLKSSENSCDGQKEHYAKLAASEAKKAITLQPMWDKPYYYLGRAYEALKKYAKAEVAYRRALKLNPFSDEIPQRRKACKGKAKQLSSDVQVAKDLQLVSVQNIVEYMQERNNDPSCNNERLDLKIKRLKFTLDMDSDLVDGHHHYFGWGTSVNLKRAAKHYLQAACRGNAEAMYTLAIMTKNGEGVNKDCLLALVILKQLSKLPVIIGFGQFNFGVREAMHMIGVMYEEGIGVTVCSKRAFKWYKRAAESGVKEAVYKIGCMYHAGLGIEADSRLALGAWYKAYFCGCKSSLVPLMKRLVEKGDFGAAEALLNSLACEDSKVPLETRAALEKILSLGKQNGPGKNDCRKSVVAQNRWPVQEIIREHRENVSKWSNKATDPNTSQLKSVVLRSIPVTLDALAGLEQTRFSDMILECPTKSGACKNIFIQVAVIDDPGQIDTAFGVVFQDLDGQVLPGLLRNFQKGPWFKYGTQLYIVNPRMVHNADNAPTIHVDDPSCLYFHDKDLSDRCRFCRKTSGRLTCEKCKNAKYCSEKCREQDLVSANHNLVCLLNMNE